MRRSSHRKVLALVVAASTAWACGGSGTTNPLTATPTPTTETFSDTLTPNGAKTFPFTALAAGTVTSTLTSLGPDATLAVGMSLGTWSGTACTLVVTNDTAVQGSIVTATSSSAGSLCVRVYDVGNLVEPLAFEVTVVHP